MRTRSADVPTSFGCGRDPGRDPRGLGRERGRGHPAQGRRSPGDGPSRRWEAGRRRRPARGSTGRQVRGARQTWMDGRVTGLRDRLLQFDDLPASSLRKPFAPPRLGLNEAHDDLRRVRRVLLQTLGRLVGGTRYRPAPLPRWQTAEPPPAPRARALRAPRSGDRGPRSPCRGPRAIRPWPPHGREPLGVCDPDGGDNEGGHHEDLRC